MVESCARPRVTGDSPSRTVVPDSAPCVTTSVLGTPRLPFGAFGARSLRAGAGGGVAGRRPALRWGARRPNRSDRITDTAVSTNSQSTARKPSLMIVSVSSDIWLIRRSPGACVEDQRRAAQTDLRPVAQPYLVDPRPV